MMNLEGLSGQGMEGPRASSQESRGCLEGKGTIGKGPAA